MKKVKSVDELSVRLSYGQSGNAPTRDYSYFSIYNALITAGSAATIGTPFSYLGQGGIYVWPGCGEAYGLAYLEAQAAGMPVVAQATAGVPAVVRHGETGILTPEGDVAAYAAAIRDLIRDDAKRQAYGRAARGFVLGERSLALASRRLAGLLREAAS